MTQITIDARELKSGGAGKGRYISELVKMLIKIDQQNIYRLIVVEKPDFELPKNFSLINLTGKKGFKVWQFIRLIRKDTSQIFFSPTSYYPILFCRSRGVLVVHDLAVYVEPKSKPAFKTLLLEKLFLPFALKKAEKVIAVSENTKADLIKVFKINDEKIVVIPLATSQAPASRLSIPAIKAKFNLPENYLLFVGTIEPRKNVETLILAHRLLPQAIRLKYPLVLVGKLGWRSDGIKQLIDSENGQFIHYLGYANEQELAIIYQHASLFIYPSWYEGFGLPVLEAMEAGVPVISSNRSSLPEVAGQAARLVDPASTSQLSEAITSLLNSSELCQNLIKQGKERVKMYSWQKTALATISIFNRL